MAKSQPKKERLIAKDDFVKLDMTFEAAMKKALNTPLPKKKSKNNK